MQKSAFQKICRLGFSCQWHSISTFLTILVDDENIIYAKLDLPSGGKVPPRPKASKQKPAEDDTVYANIAVIQPSAPAGDTKGLKEVPSHNRLKLSTPVDKL